MKEKGLSRPKQSTIKKLYGLSGNQCAAPRCNNQLVMIDEDTNKKTITSNVCHIEAASPNGPRYNQNMTNEERHHFNNLILLCSTCHIIIDKKDNESKYTVDLLKKWKIDHENKIRQITIQNNPTLLGQAINAIANIDFEIKNDVELSTNSFRIDDKIKFNSIKKNKFRIKEYSNYYGKLNSLYNELENQGQSFKKEKLLAIIKDCYLKVKGNYDIR